MATAVHVESLERDPGECMGGGWGAAPVIGSIRELDDRRTGDCPVCLRQFALDPGDSIPRHRSPRRHFLFSR
jgi:hypothetical protein